MRPRAGDRECDLVDGGRGGSNVNISSIAGKLLPPNTSAYASSKAGIQALTASMAQEVGRHGIRVNAICPGIIDTYRMDDIPRGEVGDTRVQQRIPPSDAAAVYADYYPRYQALYHALAPEFSALADVVARHDA